MLNVEARAIYYTLSDGKDNNSKLSAIFFLSGGIIIEDGCVVAMDGTTVFSNNSAGGFGGANRYEEITWYVFAK